MVSQKAVRIITIVAVLVLFVATCAAAASQNGDIWGKIGSAIGGVQMIASVIVALGLQRSWPKSAQTAIDAALKIPPDFVSDLQAKLGTPEARGRTIEELAVKLSNERKISLTAEQIHALVVVLTPLAKKIRIRIP